MLLQEGIHLLLELGRKTVAAGEDALQEAQIRVLQAVRPEQSLEEGRHTGDQVGLLLDQGLGVGLDIELGDQDAGSAADQGGMDADAQTESVEHRHDGEHLHARHASIAGGSDGLQAQGIEIEVGEHDALGGAGGAAGIEDRAAVVKVDIVDGKLRVPAGIHHIIPVSISLPGQLLHGTGALGRRIQDVQGEGQLFSDPGDQDGGLILQLRQDALHLVIELVQGQDGLGLGEIQIEGDLLGRGQGMDHVGDRADPVQGIEAVQGLRGIGHADGHLVTLADTHVPQALGGSIDALQESAEGCLLTHERIGNILRILTGGQGHHFKHGDVGIIQRSRSVTVVFPPWSGGTETHK